MSDPLIEVITEKFKAIPNIRVVVVKCTQASPLLVTVDGQGPLPAKTVAGSTFALNDTGYAIWAPPRPPFCFKVT